LWQRALGSVAGDIASIDGADAIVAAGALGSRIEQILPRLASPSGSMTRDDSPRGCRRSNC
jgi:hypothetical protein